MTTAKPIDAAALAARILAFAADPASGMMPAQTTIISRLATVLGGLARVSPSGLAVAWSEAQRALIREDIAAGVYGAGLPEPTRAATLRELLAAVCDETFAAEVIAAAGAQ